MKKNISQKDIFQGEKFQKKNPVTSPSSRVSFCPLLTLIFYYTMSILNCNMPTAEICFVLIVLQTQC